MRRPLRRLLGMSRGELAFRAQAIARRQAQRLALAARGPRWDRRRIADALGDAAACDLRDGIARGDWTAVETRLRNTIRNRPARFLLDPRTCHSLRGRIASEWPGAAAHAAAAADAIADGRFALLGYADLSFTAGNADVDWHADPVHGRRMPRRFWSDVPYLNPAHGDHKIVWELNRHQHFLALGRAYWLTGDARHADLIVRHLESWLAANPPLVGINWASALELALRSISWVWAVHFLLADVSPIEGADRSIAGNTPAWCVDLLVALDRQLVHVEQNLSYYFSPNTHLTGEALALYVAGTALPELRRSRRWQQLGRQILLREIGRQIGGDGGHVERSTHYHRYTLDIYLCALLTAQQARDTAAAARFRDAAAKLAAFMQAMADDSGWLPLVGDDDGGMLWPIAGRDPRDVRDSLALARAAIPGAPLRPWPAVEEVRWIAGRAAPDAEAARRRPNGHAPEVGTRSFPETGFVTMRTGRGDHLTFDVGPHGYLNGGHAHADALSITLTAAGRPLLIDPGTATYTMDRGLRDRMRHSASHNTVTLNGRSSSVPQGPFHWRSRADARLHACRSARAFGFAEAWHDGYDATVHCRSVLQSPGEGWLILDEILGTGTHAAELHWLFDPSWEVIERTGGLLATAGGARFWLLHEGHHVTLARGDAGRRLGWCSPRYGLVTPTWAARISRPVVAPTALATWIGNADEREPPVLDRPRVEADSGARAAAVRVRHRHRTMVALLRQQDDARRATRRAGTSDYDTDARVLQYVTGAGELNVSLADGTRALARHGGPISLAAPAPLEAVHMAASAERLEIWAPVPPAVIHLQGRMLREVRTIVLNGREAPAPRRSADTLTCQGGDWGDGRTALVVERQPLFAAAPPAGARAAGRRAHIAG